MISSLRVVWVDGQLLNRMLVERGLARVAYIYQPNTKYVDYLEKTQKKAQKLCERIGMRKEAHFTQDFWSEN
ncbi:thermonuclease family protein [Bacillus thuringiensis]|nr:thermonuclease family protein [Bacillus thuringiensis]